MPAGQGQIAVRRPCGLREGRVPRPFRAIRDCRLAISCLMRSGLAPSSEAAVTSFNCGGAGVGRVWAVILASGRSTGISVQMPVPS